MIAPPKAPPPVVILSRCFCQKLRPCLCPSPAHARCVCRVLPCLCCKLPHCACAVIGTAIMPSIATATRITKIRFILYAPFQVTMFMGEISCKFEMSIKTNGEEWKLSCFVRVLCNPYDELTTNHEVNPTLFLIFKQPQARRYENAIDNRPAQNPQIYNQGLNPAFA